MPLEATTVLGKVRAENLGPTLTHEHFSLNFKNFYREPPAELKQYLSGEIALDNVGYVRQYPYGNQSNVNFFGEEVNKAVLREMKLFKQFGGGTIVENTTHGLERDLDLCYKASKESGVNVIAGTGYYVDGTQSESARSLSVEQISEVIRQDLTIGQAIPSSQTPIKCGIIGEVASSWPITDFEKKVIHATAVVQQETGCPVSFHPGRNAKAPFEIIRLYAEAGGQLRKADMSHLDRTLQQTGELLEFAKLGTYCQFDLFGTEVSYYMLATEIDFPSDAQRIDRIKNLIENGYSDKILVSHDIHTRHRLVDYGGHGYSHLLTNVRPQMKNKGISEENLKKIFESNPATWLCF
ncbi:Parathion hydrolase-related protein [Nesidiocoris tenuis]|nr:Parathion hydrolase-related protein [Nesidiocoris tenuis]